MLSFLNKKLSACEDQVSREINAMDYLSCFSGIGGLEAKGLNPILCETDLHCREVLARQYPNAKIYNDIFDIRQLKFDLICGGWPCQDISVAGNQKGLKGSNSKLFYQFVQLAVKGNATTLVAENVSNLIRMDQGDVFREVLRCLFESGYKHIAWRMLNARSFGLPHHRNRIFLIASKEMDLAFSIFRTLPCYGVEKKKSIAAGFYWTAGTHALNYSIGYVPTLKIGSTLGIPSPPAVHYGDVVRQLSSVEAIKLQGFEPTVFEKIRASEVFKMTGNAVARPVGEFIMSGVIEKKLSNELKFKEIQSNWLSDGLDEQIPLVGYFDGKIHEPYINNLPPQSSNLDEFIELDNRSRLSSRAASGLLNRLERSGTHCPKELMAELLSIVRVSKERQ